MVPLGAHDGGIEEHNGGTEGISNTILMNSTIMRSGIIEEP